MKVKEKIALRGQVYATPRTESVEIKNQGVLCGSGGGSDKAFSLGVTNYGGKGF